MPGPEEPLDRFFWIFISLTPALFILAWLLGYVILPYFSPWWSY